MTVYFFTRADLEDAMGKSTVKAVFDEDNSGQADDRPIEACRAYGTSECKTFLRAFYGEAILPESEAAVPEELKFAALDFGLAYAMRRRPDIVRAMGEEPWTTFRDSAIEKMKQYAATLRRLAVATGTPGNVGATVGGTLVEATDRSTGVVTETTQQWSDMGDFS